jgi:hypothetical protein
MGEAKRVVIRHDRGGLERRTVVDMLDTHDVEEVVRWFSAHPNIHRICRTATGGTRRPLARGPGRHPGGRGRFHLAQNLREIIEWESLHHLRVGGSDPVWPASSQAVNVIEPAPV